MLADSGRWSLVNDGSVDVSSSVGRTTVFLWHPVADPQGGEGAIAPPQTGAKKILTPPPKKFIARPKNAGICKPAFA